MKSELKSKAVILVIYGLILFTLTRIRVPFGLENSIKSLVILIIIGELSSIIRRELNYVFISLGIFFFFFYLPFDVPKVYMGLFGMGISLIFFSAKFKESFMVLSRGVGLSVSMYSLSTLLPILSPLFRFVAIFSAIGYGLAFLESIGVFPGDNVRRNLLGIIIVGALIGIVRISEVELFPQILWFGVKAISLLLALAIAGIILNSIPSKRKDIVVEVHVDPDELKIKNEMYKEAEKVVKDFIIKGEKSGLVSYVTYYAIKAGMKREDVAKIISPIVDYEPRKPSALTPKWFAEILERREIEKRKMLVKKALGGILNE
ncbi:hypothetical protein [Pyrococcus abyssi]|uniref:Uncharacterized protein n=1 Tax=Pyrococcus abyssi (strain GE5 / Orsay) TaxID=272844 RepID=Q9UY75_PYRAB|nr:hypothetical protein [Pyrococcus abyssi]CAB50537.1 Hypothetical protein PAB1275 [Pyrococcus abyssi GE5]CCE71094.1 TPA: hypothetical protein PAB1275 [Pyrococcus abyssi GE5]